MIEETEFYRIMEMLRKLTDKGREQTPAYARLLDRAFEIAPKDVSDDWVRIAIDLGYIEPEQALMNSPS